MINILTTALLSVLAFGGTKINQGVNHRYALEDQKVELMKEMCAPLILHVADRTPLSPQELDTMRSMCEPLVLYLEGQTPLSKPSILMPITGPTPQMQGAQRGTPPEPAHGDANYLPQSEGAPTKEYYPELPPQPKGEDKPHGS
jgi:hypothetical protein